MKVSKPVSRATMAVLLSLLSVTALIFLPFPALADNADYTFDATDGDRVDVTFTTENCAMGYYVLMPSGGSDGPHYGDYSFIAADNGRFSIRVESIVAEGSSGSMSVRSHDCGPNTYTLGVTVTPNDRPAIVVLTAPSAGVIGEPIDLVVRATDLDGNLARVGVRFGTFYNYEPMEWVEVSGSEATATFTHVFAKHQRNYFSFFVEDAVGARGSTSELSILIHQDDCALGRDAISESVPFPVSCRGALWPDLAPAHNDLSDEYNVDVTTAQPRIYVGYLRRNGNLSTRIRVKPSGGVTVTATDKSLFLPATQASWKVVLDRISGQGGYLLSVRGIGPPSPPDLTASFSASSIHQGDPTTLTFTGSDPNDERLYYEITWGDGSAVERVPVTGTLASGEASTLTHTYLAAVASPAVSVRAINEEGLSRSVSVPLAVALHNDCGRGAGYDAPDNESGIRRLASGICLAEIGYNLSDGKIDAIDSFFTSRSAGAKGLNPVRIEVYPDPGVTVSLYTRVLGSKVSAKNADPLVLDLPPFFNYVFFVELVGGRGSYRIVYTEPSPV